ncbi:carbohydrate ABC transporter permease [Ponticoccus sp. SC2-23]|uniref:carbohydrate ABC transporter permease n=1 Tax=Alexandriicola marinus TaxID=2081710 RepID=UPI000FD8811F|nr:carbohydrate ABC transporter permease [Alexandriicola marinus]MBM1218968.1 carbohydrate ABC transporter permease [Ponticoccus sp. SC6-9]MBM1223960.1 carbohydrate ABC transporter permease [Ponticoccus sp. SC6-15]MBM1230261.1 carbohydrate ABC transporter permease [Ponticoccus sp. SC6-38]MBM1232926.1 carbohydrate ABC transporter permease [Ponticoccus sp. SC6-45]MBM1237124.1 carbohydrate ABC transporter permease [Ponticoccus sp. SC6-49]MBM1241937.1 carbohydrate ABC transporter permease [Pontic
MSALRFGYVAAPLLGALWMVTLAVTVAVAMSFATGEAFRPAMLWSLVWGAIGGAAFLAIRPRRAASALVAVAVVVFIAAGVGPVVVGPDVPALSRGICGLILGIGFAASTFRIMEDLSPGALTRHEFEGAVIRFLTGFGYIFFTAIVLIPFYVMVMTSLKNQSELVMNPLDFSIDLSKGWDLFRSYEELFRDFNFGTYMVNSALISVLTVIITLLFAVPGAYAVARLRFRGRAAFSRSILLIYMVPMIVLALPIYIAFSMTGLRNTFFGIVLIYPVTTIPVALYMLQGYFRGLPSEVEEAGLMDGLTRLAVIWKITLPLSLPALASVSLYVFMIAWNEFLLAFMLLDDPSKFTLTRGIASLNSSEIPRQHLMAGSVVATVPIMVIFLGLERFMTKGLTAGSVKG